MNAVIYVTGWVLLHFVWQGAAIALVVALLLRGARHASARARYIIACVGLVAMIATPAVTAWQVADAGFPAPSSQNVSPGNTSNAVPGRLAAARGNTQPPGVSLLRPIDVEKFFPPLVVAWLVGATTLLLTRWRGWRRVRALHHAALRLPTSQWQTCAERFARLLGITSPFRVVELLRLDVPMVVGWLRPIVILPIALCAEMPPAHIEAVLAHEIAHVYRRDYLVNLAQMVAEAVLFYHPGVWWISARIRLERELCCDDLAIHLCGDRMTYARALAEVEQLRIAKPQFGLAVTDGPLVTRLRRILGSADTRECPRHGVSVVVAAMIAIGLIAGVEAIATGSRFASSTLSQRVAPVASGLQFEAASVVPNRSGLIEAELHPAPDGSLVARNAPLWTLLEFAYGVPTYRTQGLPDWAFRERFDIAAKSRGASPPSRDRIALMLRSLLEQRFMVQTRTEVRQLPVYELQLDRVDGRLGPDLTRSTRADCEALANGQLAREQPFGDRPCGVAQGAGSLRATGVTLSALAETLAPLVNRPVIDRTGLAGLFNADVNFRQDRSPLPVSAAPFDRPANTGAPFIFAALREQLGLRLVPGRGDVEVLVVTSVERLASD